MDGTVLFKVIFAFSVVHMSIWTQSKEYTIRFGDDNSTIQITNILRHLHWKQVIVLYHDEYRTFSFSLLANIQAAIPVTLTTIMQLPNKDPDGSDVKDTLIHLHRMNFPSLKFILVTSYQRSLTILHSSEEIDLESNRTTDFWHQSYWIVICADSLNISTEDLPNVRQIQNAALILPNAMSDASSCMSIYALTSTANGRAFLSVSNLASDEKTNLKARLFPNVKFGLNNKHLIILTKETIVMDVVDGQAVGYMADVLNGMATALNFSYTITDAVDLSWGVQHNGSYEGSLIGKLASREVDMIVAQLSINNEREEVMDFLLPPTLIANRDVMYKFVEVDIGWNVYFKSFKPAVLSALVTSLVIVTLISGVLYIWELGISDTRPTLRRSNVGVFIDIFQVVFEYYLGILIAKGVHSHPRIWSLRLLLFSWGLFSVLTTAIYGGNLAALFTVQKQALPFRNLKELVQQKEYKWGLMNESGSIYVEIFKNSGNKDLRAFWNGAVEMSKGDPEVLSENFDLHIEKVLREKYAFISNRDILEQQLPRDCHLRLMKQNILFDQIGIGVPSNYPLKSEMEQILSDFTDYGLLRTWKKKHQPTRQNNCTTVDSAQTRTLSDLQIAFYIIITGLATSVFVLGTELLITMRRKSHYT